MPNEINCKVENIQDAFGLRRSQVDKIADRMSDICNEADNGKKPVGFLAQRVSEEFSHDELQIIATMLLVRVINENNEKEGCDCPACRANRGEKVSEDEIMQAIQSFLKEKLGVDAIVMKVPTSSNGKQTVNLKIMLPTAIEVLNKEINWDSFSSKFPETADIIEKSMIEFAKLHVQEALKSASKKVKYKNRVTAAGTLCDVIDKESILNAYPLENIK